MVKARTYSIEADARTGHLVRVPMPEGQIHVFVKVRVWFQPGIDVAARIDAIQEQFRGHFMKPSVLAHLENVITTFIQDHLVRGTATLIKPFQPEDYTTLEPEIPEYWDLL